MSAAECRCGFALGIAVNDGKFEYKCIACGITQKGYRARRKYFDLNSDEQMLTVDAIGRKCEFCHHFVICCRKIKNGY